jgi:hypothetical protein
MLRASVLGSLCVTALSAVACSSDGGAGKAGDAAAPAAATRADIPGSGDGFHFTYSGTMSSASPSAKAPEARNVSTTVRVRGGKARVDFPGDMAPGVAAGTYALMDAGSATMTLVMPAKKEAMTMSPGAMAGSMQGMAGMMKMTVTDTSSKMEDLGDGERVLGFATRKFRVTTGYTMNVSMMGTTTSMRTENTSVVQVSEAVGALDAGFTTFGASFARNFGAEAAMAGTGFEQLKALSSLQPKGFPLVMEQETRMIRAGDTTQTRTSWRMTELARGGVEPADLTLPEGYKVTDLAAMMKTGMEGARRAMPAGVRP